MLQKIDNKGKYVPATREEYQAELQGWLSLGLTTQRQMDIIFDQQVNQKGTKWTIEGLKRRFSNMSQHYIDCL